MRKLLASLMLGSLIITPVSSYAVGTGNENISFNKNAHMLAAMEKAQEFKVTGLNIKSGSSGPLTSEVNTISVKTNFSNSKAKYKFVYNYEGKWQDWGVISDFTNSTEVKWTPKKAGLYKLIVDVDDGNGNISSAVFSVKVDKNWSNNGVAANSSMVIGQAYDINAKVSGNADFKYKFVYNYEGKWGEWGVIQDFSSKASARFVPKKFGNYDIIVDIQDQHGNIETKSITINANYGWTHDGVESVSTATIDDKISLKAKASGNTSGLKYKFVWSYDEWSDWGVLSPLSSNDAATFSTNKPGQYDIHVDIVDAKGNVVTKSKTIAIKDNWDYNGVNLSKSTLNVGSTTRITPNVTGNKNGLKYKYVYSYNNWSEWGVIKDFSDTSALDFVPKRAGIYTIHVDIQDKFGRVKTKSIPFNTNYGWNFSGVDGVKDTTTGNKLNISPRISGDTKDLSYKIVYSYNNWNEWKVIKEYSSTPNASFIPKKPGKYDIYIDIQDKFGNVVTKSDSMNVNASWSFVGVSLSSNNADPGQTVVIKPSVSGNTKGLKYKFVYSYMDWSEWGVIRSFSTTDNAAFKTSKKGYYDVHVDITDEYGYTVTKSARINVSGGYVPVLKHDWYSVINPALKNGGNYVIVDVRTGKRFNAKRWSGTNHADMEPLTLKDTAILNEIYGGKWSWDRRPVVVLNGVNAYAGSINGMPHGDDTLPNNGFSGHICVHFFNSRTHGSNKVDPRHKQAVEEAAALGQIRL